MLLDLPARNLVSGAIVMRCLSCILPTFNGSKTLDPILTDCIM
jgi:hypothetical protein